MELEAIRGDQSGNQRSSEDIRGHQRSSEVIRGHQRSSEVISGHQRSSAVIRGHQSGDPTWPVQLRRFKSNGSSGSPCARAVLSIASTFGLRSSPQNEY